ncbi:iron-sulfur clusters transporter ABCB7, mitochondrial-like [Mytilus edulis]|uniref:iron-sulfur clusters transporter ABCB7, mitochondrial-like n=1 Tax=Mytilus edulis TaxID=6550 RepID=UPI0039F05CF0
MALTRLLYVNYLHSGSNELACIFKRSTPRGILQNNQKLLRCEKITWSKLLYQGHLTQARKDLPKWNLLSRLSNRLNKNLYKDKRQFNTTARLSNVIKDSASKDNSGWRWTKALLGAKNVRMLKKMMRYVWPKNNVKIKVRVVIALSLLVGSKVVSVMVPFIFKWAVDNLNEASGDTLNLNDTPTAILSLSTALLISYGLVRLTASFMKEMQDFAFAEVAENTIRRIAQNIFVHLHSLDLSYHLSKKKGELTKAIDRGSRAIEPVLKGVVFRIFPTFLEVGLVTGILGYKFGGGFVAVTLGCVGCYIVFTFRMTEYRTKFRKQKNKADQDAGNIANDSLVNYTTVKYFTNEKFEAKKHEETLERFEKASLQITKTLSLLNFGQNAIFSVGSSIVMVMAAQQILAGTMTIGDLVMVNGLLIQLTVPLNFLGSTYRDLNQGFVDMDNMFALMEIQPKIKNKLNAPVLLATPSESAISFKDVHFEYLPGQNILNGLSFDVPSGKKVAIVGGSGSGKSTIVRLLFRFFDPQQGSIHINNQSIDAVDLHSLRKAIGVVPQDCILFHDTVFSNIQYGDLEKTAEEVYEAARVAKLHDSIMNRFPNQYETLVGERGLILSGGEKQRVAIARAILKNPPIIVYDEATSSLDTITEQDILMALRRITRKHTTIVIAHRLSTVVDADQILVLEKGSVAEKGTHYELLSNPNSLYCDLWAKQNQLLTEKDADETEKILLENRPVDKKDEGINKV